MKRENETLLINEIKWLKRENLILKRIMEKLLNISLEETKIR